MKESPAVPATITFFISTAFCTLKKGHIYQYLNPEFLRNPDPNCYSFN